MNHMIMQNKFFPLFVISIHLLLSIVSSQTLGRKYEVITPFPGQKYEVHIVYNFEKSKSPLLVHCNSKDDNLGDHTLRTNEDFHWNFKINLWATTLYYCRFRWESKDITFDVFNKKLVEYCGTGENRCVWVVREDGFWISSQFPPHNAETQLHTWP